MGHTYTFFSSQAFSFVLCWFNCLKSSKKSTEPKEVLWCSHFGPLYSLIINKSILLYFLSDWYPLSRRVRIAAIRKEWEKCARSNKIFCRSVGFWILFLRSHSLSWEVLLKCWLQTMVHNLTIPYTCSTGIPWESVRNAVSWAADPLNYSMNFNKIPRQFRCTVKFVKSLVVKRSIQVPLNFYLLYSWHSESLAKT